jgi:DNA-binding SARP family transcriptional activator
MRLYVLNGQRVEALRQYERCRRILKNDCGVDPMPETSALYREIETGAVFSHINDERAIIVERRDEPAF